MTETRREMLLRHISENEFHISTCPHQSSGWRGCGTCARLRTDISRLHDEIAELDAAEPQSDRVPHLPWIIDKAVKAINHSTRTGATETDRNHGEALRRVMDDAIRQCAATITEALVIHGGTI